MKDCIQYSWIFIFYVVFYYWNLGFALMGFDFTSALGVAAATLGSGSCLGHVWPRCYLYALPGYGQLWAALMY